MNRKIAILSLFCLSALCLTAQTIKSPTSVRIDGQDYYVHTVAKGDTFYSLGRTYSVADSVILRNNPQTADGLKTGQLLKIPFTVAVPVATPKQLSKIFTRHTVVKGETAYGISRSYGISLQTLIDDNPGFDPSSISEGQVVLIRKKEIGDTSDNELHNQWEDYRQKVNSVTDNFKYHIVKPGETLYSLGRMYSVSADDIATLNGITDGNIKVQSMIKIPEITKATAKDIVVEQPVFDKFTTPEIALMLPLSPSGKSSKNFLEFYQGALLAMEDIKGSGLSANLNVYDTGRSSAKVESITESSDFEGTDLIIGPVYAEAMTPALRYAEQHSVPIVSPLGSVSTENNMLYQAAPDVDAKYAKLDSIIDRNANTNIVVVTSNNDDREFTADIQKLLAVTPHTTYRYNSATDGGEIAGIIDWDRNNVFVILAADEVTVDKTLAGISSAYNNTAARTARQTSIRILGTPRWSRYTTLDKNLYFKLSVTFITSYHTDRTNVAVRAFDTRYVAKYGHLPSPYSYKGYDVTKMFAQALFATGESFDQRLRSVGSTPIESPYNFKQKVHSGTFYNDQWIMVTYNPDYTISAR